jgi:hypothetical protein
MHGLISLTEKLLSLATVKITGRGIAFMVGEDFTEKKTSSGDI